MRTIFDIAAFGTATELEEVLHSRVDCSVNILDDQGCSLIGNAAKFGNEENVELLWRLGADLNLCNLDAGGEPPIHSALIHDHLDTARLLLEKGADLERRGWMGLTGYDRIAKFQQRHPGKLTIRK